MGWLWRARTPTAVTRIVVIEMTRLGDLCSASALLEPLRRAFPGAALELIGDQAYSPLFPGLRYHGLPARGGAFLKAAWALRLELRDPGLLLVSASPAVRHSLLAWLSRPGRVAGYLFPRAGSPLDYDAAAPLQHAEGSAWSERPGVKGQHMVERAGGALAVLGLSLDGLRPALDAGVARIPGRVVLHAGANWDRRRWPLARYAELAAALASEGADVRFIAAEAGDPGALAKGVTRSEGLDLAGLRDLLASASLFIGNDSGPLHLAAALGTPCLGLFGPNLEACSGPWPLPGPASPHRSLHEDVPCRPCGQVVCIQPWDWCMEKLSFARVLGEARSMLQRSHP
jgi:hypothetical protein